MSTTQGKLVYIITLTLTQQAGPRPQVATQEETGRVSAAAAAKGPRPS